MSQQLSLELDASGDPSMSPLPSRLPFAVATDGGVPFDDAARFFEPWWPGAQAYLRREGGTLELRTEHFSDPFTAFPELADGIGPLSADGLIIEGTLLALDADGRPDAQLLRRRLDGDDQEPGQGAFVASDLIYLEGAPLARQPYLERRRQLSAIVTDSDHCVVGRGLAAEGSMLARAVVSLGLSAISARRLDAPWRAGRAGDAWLRLTATDAPARPTRPFLVLLERLPLE
jgi:bifunctional non-homologous end joining protein LigD